jgi:hypothetical protein
MATLPRKPQQGDRALQSMYDSICQIIDYLPSLDIVGDNKSVRVNNYRNGRTIEVLNTATPTATEAVGDNQAIFVQVWQGDSYPLICEGLDKNFKPLTSERYAVYYPGVFGLNKIPSNSILLVHKMQIKSVTGEESNL